ncbi:hypothetical protein [Roseateles sp.]|jgi:hypothetical protein|uniref:hypothetical protein n=1 Tax=Roseateles sp. TaxID=1971397 RepID=UPI00391C29AC
MHQDVVLWRVVYTHRANLTSGPFAAGPWHPDKGYIEHCAAQLRNYALQVGVQNNQQATKAVSSWIKAG